MNKKKCVRLLDGGKKSKLDLTSKSMKLKTGSQMGEDARKALKKPGFGK